MTRKFGMLFSCYLRFEIHPFTLLSISGILHYDSKQNWKP